jgi:hypothetical protein
MGPFPHDAPPPAITPESPMGTDARRARFMTTVSFGSVSAMPNRSGGASIISIT